MLSVTHFVLAALGWASWRLFYNLYLHPLARFPGPRLAAATVWWRTYIELWKGQGLTAKIIELHEIYGDVVRIGPNDLHFAKPAAFHDIYSPSNKWAKDGMLYDVLSVTGVHSLAMTDYHEAKKRREPMIPFFSRKNVMNNQAVIQEKLDLLYSVLNKQDAKTATNIMHMYHSFTLDTITAFCFAESADALRAPGFDSAFVSSMQDVLPFMPYYKHFHFLLNVSHMIPPSVGAKLSTEMAGLYRFIELLEKSVQKALRNSDSLTEAPHDTIYGRLLQTRDGQQPLTPTELVNEANMLVFAGTDTTGNTLTTGTVYILDNPAVYKKLKAELSEAWPDLSDTPTYEQLDKLPYLKAVIKEALRLTVIVTWPLGRVVGSEGAIIDGHAIPAGTTVAIGNNFVHHSESIFPDPYTFKPERWLEPGAESLDYWLISFHRGSRSCTGTNFAWCQLTLAFANIFRRFDLAFDGDLHVSDMQFKECYLPYWVGKPMKAYITPVLS